MRTKRVTVEHKGKRYQGNIKRCLGARQSYLTIWQAELLESGSFNRSERNTVLMLTENFISAPQLMVGDLVMVKGRFYLVLDLPDKPLPTERAKLGDIERDTVMYTALENLRFPTPEETLLSVCMLKDDVAVEQYLTSWELDWVGTYINTDPRLRPAMVDQKATGWPTNHRKTLARVINALTAEKRPEPSSDVVEGIPAVDRDVLQ